MNEQIVLIYFVMCNRELNPWLALQSVISLAGTAAQWGICASEKQQYVQHVHEDVV